LWLVRFVIKKMNLPHNSILNEDDFISVGILGLSESIDRYSTDRGVKFESYAIARIRGIIQDEMRKLDWLSRTARKKAIDFINANDELTVEAGVEVSQEDIMRKLDISPEQYRKYVAAAAAAKTSMTLNESSMSRDSEDSNILENMPQDPEDSFYNAIEKNERDILIREFITSQKEKPRLVMSLYYYEELTFKEIGTILNVSESRICQIHSQVIKDLRKHISKFNND